MDRLLKGRVSDLGISRAIGLLWSCERAKEGERGGTPDRIGLAIRSGARRREHACKGQSGE